MVHVRYEQIQSKKLFGVNVDKLEILTRTEDVFFLIKSNIVPFCTTFPISSSFKVELEGSFNLDNKLFDLFITETSLTYK